MENKSMKAPPKEKYISFCPLFAKFSVGKHLELLFAVFFGLPNLKTPYSNSFKANKRQMIC